MPNFDEKTGIRYGVISPHAISSWSLDEIYQNGTDPAYESGIDEIKKSLNTVFEIAGIHNEDKQQSIYDEILEEYSDHYCDNDSGIMDYSDSDYDLHVSGDNFGIFVMRSPYYTYCQNCSPCAPGAGDLNAPIEKPGIGHDRTYCLGPEWFDQSGDQYSRKIPYRVFRVEDDREVI